MTYDEFKACLRLAGLSMKDLAAILDMQPNSITNYRAKGSVPRYLAVVARLVLETKKLGADIEQVVRDVQRP